MSTNNNNPSPSLAYILNENTDPADHVKVGSFYQIDHSKLPPKSPDILNSINIVMVNEKTRLRVSLRFPSIQSLRTYFTEGYANSSNKKLLPGFDEKFTIGSEAAADVLYRRIPPQEITEKKNVSKFWSATVDFLPLNRSKVNNNNNNNTSTKGISMLKWGQKRQVKYLARHRTSNDKSVISSTNQDQLMVISKEEKSDQESEEESSENDDLEKKKGKSGNNLKRKGKMVKKKKGLVKKLKCEAEKGDTNNNNSNNQIVAYNHKKPKVFKSSYDRWSRERYHMAEVNMLKIMKEKNAVFGSPMLRPELREQARRLIGDTGLLDHLLKHMAGKVAPSGEERFRRRHNAEGAMEYWLEKSDLVDIRRQAGVQDPYWTPPSGWTPGDNPTQDPICAKEIKELKQEIAKLKSDMEEVMLYKKNHVPIETTPISFETSTTPNVEHDNLLILKEMYIDLVNKKAKIEEQLLELSESLCGMEEDMGKLKTTMEGPDREEPSERLALMELSESVIAETGIKSPASTEDKAAKIERLKSGFRICKPQGTFLWPNNNRGIVVQFEDRFSVQTPPSVSSTSAKQTHFLATTLPVAEKRTVNAINALSSAATKPIENIHSTTTQFNQNSSIGSTISTTSITTPTKLKTSMINLNEPPANLNDNINELPCGTQSQSHGQPQTPSFPVTYQRRHSSTSAVPNLGTGNQGKELIRCCSASSTTSSSLSVGAAKWMALGDTSKSDSIGC